MVKKRRLKITDEQKKKCNAIIHTHSLMCGGVGTGLAQIPLADNAVITPIQIAMIIELGVVFEQKISNTIAQSILSGASASLIGRGVSQVLFGWIPGVGNAINTATAAGLTEAIGWMAVDRFSKEKFYDDSTEESESTNDVMVNDETNNAETPSEEDFQDIIEKTNLFFDGVKSYSNDKQEYEDLLNEIESRLRTIPSEHVLREIYNKLCDLPLQ